jgi:hypothetical protein
LKASFAASLKAMQISMGNTVSEHPSNKPQMKAAAYRLPAMDIEFLLGDSTRGIRFQLEYQKAEEHLRAWGVETTVVVFGSARVKPGAPMAGMTERAPSAASARRKVAPCTR